MRRKSHATDLSSEEVVKGIRRATRKRHSAEEKRLTLIARAGLLWCWAAIQWCAARASFAGTARSLSGPGPKAKDAAPQCTPSRFGAVVAPANKQKKESPIPDVLGSQSINGQRDATIIRLAKSRPECSCAPNQYQHTELHRK